MALIPAEQHFAVFTAILVLSAMAFASERTVIGQKITGTVVVILLAIAAANMGLIPHSAPAYSFIFSYIVPMLIPLFLFQADVRRLAKEASRTTAAFLVATLGTVAACGPRSGARTIAASIGSSRWTATSSTSPMNCPGSSGRSGGRTQRAPTSSAGRAISTRRLSRSR